MLAFPVALTALGLMGEVANWGAVAALWLFSLSVLSLGAWSEARKRRIYSSIEVDEAGIRSTGFTLIDPMSKAEPIRRAEWHDVSAVSPALFPVFKSKQDVHGIRLIFGEHQLCIFETLNDYHELVRIVEARFPRKKWGAVYRGYEEVSGAEEI